MLAKLVVLVLLQVVVSFADLDTSDGPLLLTPYITNNLTAKAKSLSEVKNLPNSPSFESYSGYLTVDNKYNSNLFFWFIPSLNNANTAPVFVYLEGGPGISSLFSVFGYSSLLVDNDLKLSVRPFGLIQEFSVIYVDNPVGVGYSFTDNEKGLSNDQTSIADNLYEFLRQFYKIFDEYKNNELYVIGESYGGKYAPALGHKLMRMADHSGFNFNGILVGNGWTDPVNQMNHANQLKTLGLIDLKQFEYFKSIEDKVKAAIKAGHWKEAHDLNFELFVSMPNSPSVATNFTGYMQFYDISHTMMSSAYELFNFPRYLAQDSTKHALHVGNSEFALANQSVQAHLRDDFMKSEMPSLTALVDGNYKVLLYTGNFDMSAGVDATAAMLENKEWKYFKDYYSAQRIIYKVNDTDTEIGGYIKTFGNFSHAIVRNAGHCAPADQPRVTLDLIKRFVYSKPFTN